MAFSKMIGNDWHKNINITDIISYNNNYWYAQVVAYL